MAVDCVYLNADVYLSCVCHALSTDKEEVMGLLIGNVTEIDDKRVSNVSGVIMLCRSDKKMDRVEISPEQLSDAATQAEDMAVNLGRPMRVLGWYHSHPHITVWPSHIDVRTQAMYQLMDAAFIGLIFSVFNEDKVTKVNRIQVTCFQSLSQGIEDETDQIVSVEVPLRVVPSPRINRLCLDSLVDLPSVLRREELESLNKVRGSHLLDSETPTDLLTSLYNSAVYTKSLCNVTEVTSLPLLDVLDCRLRNVTDRIKQLQDERDKLAHEVKRQKVFK